VTSTPIRTDGANYIVKVREAEGISLSNLRAYDYYVGEIIRIDTGAVAYNTRGYDSIRAARLQAARYIKRYEHHLAKHGIGFEEQEAARKAEERAERDAKRRADRRVRDEAHATLGSLRKMLGLLDAVWSLTEDNYATGDWQDVLEAQAVLARIDGEA